MIHLEFRNPFRLSISLARTYNDYSLSWRFHRSRIFTSKSWYIDGSVWEPHAANPTTSASATRACTITTNYYRTLWSLYAKRCDVSAPRDISSPSLFVHYVYMTFHWGRETKRCGTSLHPSSYKRCTSSARLARIVQFYCHVPVDRPCVFACAKILMWTTRAFMCLSNVTECIHILQRTIFMHYVKV